MNFITASKTEQALLDQGAFGAWARTGATFRAYATAESGTQPVCRFYGLASAGLNSHFYSASPAECADVAVRFAGSRVTTPYKWLRSSSRIAGIARLVLMSPIPTMSQLIISYASYRTGCLVE